MFENLNKDAGNNVDDIFADTDQIGGEASNKPLTPIDASQMAPRQPLMEKPMMGAMSDFTGEKEAKQGGILKKLLIVIIILAVLGVIAYFVYSKILVPQTLNKNLAVNNTEELFKDQEKETNTTTDNIATDTNEINSTTEGTNIEENEASYLDLLKNVDTDKDGLNDYEETYVYFTDPSKADTDTDTLNDFDEVKIFGTDSLNPDSDGDTYLDGKEVFAGYNPLATTGKLDPASLLDPVLFNEKYPSLKK